MMGTGSSMSSYFSLAGTFLSSISEMQAKGNFDKATAVYGSPLTPMECMMFFENQNYIPEAEYISEAETPHGRDSFRDCRRSSPVGLCIFSPDCLVFVSLGRDHVVSFFNTRKSTKKASNFTGTKKLSGRLLGQEKEGSGHGKMTVRQAPST
ncbi:hypothetical protein AKJ16_DCAP15308 [Drosera capensis]